MKSMTSDVWIFLALVAVLAALAVSVFVAGLHMTAWVDRQAGIEVADAGHVLDDKALSSRVRDALRYGRRR